jgi:polysaccharide deacetylase family protein (PEP-CTERM system associated)
MINAFTIDIEDYFQVAAFEKIISPDDWGTFDYRVEANTERLLMLLGDAGVCATFFMLGWVAERSPQLVRRIAEAGHEVASHGYAHQLIYRQSLTQFRDDVHRTRELLCDVSGQAVIGYRAPSWSITSKSSWAHSVLIDEGYQYDSSVFPIKHDLHGTPDAPRCVHCIETDNGSIVEFPPSTVAWFGRNFPTGGGGFFRLYPYCLTRYMLQSINREQTPFTFYIHPWEVDPNQPRISGASFKSRFRHYVNLRTTYSKLERLVTDFQFQSLGKQFETIDRDSLPVRRVESQV